LASVIYELATNAAKYGAWSAPTGRVSLNWSLLPGDQMPRSNSSGGKRRTAREGSDRQGLCSVLVEQGIPQARVKRDFKPTGVVCTIDVSVAVSA